MHAKLPWHIADDGLTLAVRLTPKGGRDALDGVEQRSDGVCVLKARVRVAPRDGEANTALRMLVAKALGVTPSRVHLVGGLTSRIKTLKIDGDGQKLAGTLSQSVGKATA